MKTPHKHAELIKAWADGAEIECLVQPSNTWELREQPIWSVDATYRIKPEPKPDVVWFAEGYLEVFKHQKVPQLTAICQKSDSLHNLKLTFDGETGKLKSAEVL